VLRCGRKKDYIKHYYLAYNLSESFKNMGYKILQEYFNKQENVILALIFGTNAKGMAGEESDMDIAIYLKDEKEEDRIWLDLSKIITKEVDLVLLNKAPFSLVSNIFKTGIPLLFKTENYLLTCIYHVP